MDSGEAKDLFADIAQVGPGGNFLKSKNNRQIARSDEFFYPTLTDRHTFEAWNDLGQPGMYTQAWQKVEEILAGPAVDPLPEPVVKESWRKKDSPRFPPPQAETFLQNSDRQGSFPIPAGREPPPGSIVSFVVKGQELQARQSLSIPPGV